LRQQLVRDCTRERCLKGPLGARLAQLRGLAVQAAAQMPFELGLRCRFQLAVCARRQVGGRAAAVLLVLSRRRAPAGRARNRRGVLGREAARDPHQLILVAAAANLELGQDLRGYQIRVSRVAQLMAIRADSELGT
jgi:hypothetical protein